MKVRFQLNGKDQEIDVPAAKRLAHILRDDFGLLQVQTGCGEGRCGSCTVLLNDRPVPACLVPAFEAEGARIISPEGFVETENYADVEQAFLETGYDPCDFCRKQKSMIITALLDQNLNPTPLQIRRSMSDISCNCCDPDLLVPAVRCCAMYMGRRLRERR